MQGTVMQATVRTFRADSRTGSVLFDDGRELAYPPAAFEASGLLGLRTGQRVRVVLDDAGRVQALTLATLPF